MKKNKFLLLVWLVTMLGIARGQSPCALPTIVTDPDNAINSERPDQTNSGNLKFDWRTGIPEDLNPNILDFLFYNQKYETVGDRIPNIFFDQTGNPLATPINKDFQPQDGWELVKKDFGYMDDGSTVNPVAAPAPYIILYNRYSGTLRVIASFLGFNAQSHDKINITLKFIDPIQDQDNYANLTTTGLFNNAAAIATSLDKPTMITQVTASCLYYGDKNFFYADFQTTYDPCTCLFESGLVVEFETYDVGTVTMTGKLLGTQNPLEAGVNLATMDYSTYLPSLYDQSAPDAVKNAGMLTYSNINQMVQDYNEETDKIADANKKANAVAAISKIASVTAVATSETGAVGLACEGLALMTSFLASKMDKPAPTPPSVIHGEMTVSGTATDSRSVTGADISIANPGSKNSSTRPSIDYETDPINAPTQDNITYPMYNIPLGVFSLLNTPKIDFYRGLDMTQNGDEDAYDWIKYAWKLSSPIQYAFNPSLDIDYDLTTVKAAYVIELYPEIYDANYYQNLPDYSHYLYNIYKFGSPVNKAIYMTDFYDLETFSNVTPWFEYSTYAFDHGPVDIEHKVSLRFVVNVVYKTNNSASYSTASPYPVRNNASFILTYDVDLSGSLNDFTGIGLGYQGGYLGYYDNLTLGNTNFDPYSSGYKQGQENFGSVQKVCWRNSIIINGNLSPGPGINLVYLIAGDDVSQTCESVIDCEFVLETSSVINKPIASPRITDGNQVYSFCMGNNPTMNSYQGNVNGTASNAVARKEVNAMNSNQKLDMNMNVYPNPVSGTARINYTVPEGDNVFLLISDPLGREILRIQEQYQSRGEYQTDFPTEKLNEGLYYCTLQVGEKLITRRISVVK